MISVFRKEISSFLNSLIAYMVIAVFLTGIGLLMWIFPETSVLEYGYSDMETLFSLGPYVLMFLIPAITMKSFAEEKKTGTIELLITRPLTNMQVILGKYLAGLVVVLLTLIPTLIYYFSIYKLGSPQGNIDTAAVAGSYVGLLLLSGFFVSIGIFASAITENQIVAFIIAVFLCFFFYTGISSIASIDEWSGFSAIFEKLGIPYHYNALSKGLLDSRNILYFLSATAITLLLTNLILNSRKW